MRIDDFEVFEGGDRAGTPGCESHSTMSRKDFQTIPAPVLTVHRRGKRVSGTGSNAHRREAGPTDTCGFHPNLSARVVSNSQLFTLHDMHGTVPLITSKSDSSVAQVADIVVGHLQLGQIIWSNG